MSSPYPEAARLARDVARLRLHEGETLGRFMPDAVLKKLYSSLNKDNLRVAYYESLGQCDSRIRFVEGDRYGRPKGTLKLFGAMELARYSYGERMEKCLEGGVVVVVTSKEGVLDEWRLSGIHEFLPAGEFLRVCEEALESLSQAFKLRNTDEPFPALSEPPFQVRTGSSTGGYAVYLLASHVFGAFYE